MRTNRLAAVSSAGLALLAAAAAPVGRIFGAENIRRAIQSQKRDHMKGAAGSIATANRWNGQPHQHKREIARRLRQQARHVA